MKIPTLGPRKICEGIYLVGSTLRSSVYDSAVYAVIGDDGAVAMIDCGSPFGLEGVEANLEKLGTDFSAAECVIATHGHYDHVGGMAALKRIHPHIRFSIHEGDTPAVEEGDADATCAGWMFQEDVEPVKADRLLVDGDTINAAGTDFDIYSMPGHSPGSIAIVTETREGTVVFTGDAYVPSCDLVGYDFDDLTDTWSRLIDLEPDFVCPGHYDHHYTHPLVRAITGNFGSRPIRDFISNPDMARIISTLGTRMYRTGKVPLFLKSFYNVP